MSWSEYIDEFEKEKERVLNAGGSKKIEVQHSKGKLTARERIDAILDQDSFVELYSMVESRLTEFGMTEKKVPGDGVIVGYGTIDGDLVYISSQDFTIMGGSLGEAQALKICYIMQRAYKDKAPIIYINDSGGARIEEGVLSLNGYSLIFKYHIMLSGVCPQIALILGPCAGGACYGPALCDIVITVRGTTKMFITGPGVVSAVTGEQISAEDLGGANVHATKSGVSHLCFDTENQAFEASQLLVNFLNKKNNIEKKRNFWRVVSSKKKTLMDIVPDDSRKSYDMRAVIDNICDEFSFLEFFKDFAPNIIIGIGRIKSERVAIVANQPSVSFGTLDIDASEKAARFIRFADAFNIPILTLVDTPGFMPGSKQEHQGIIRHGAKLLYAYGEATTLKITVILRKAYGGAYIAMNSIGMGADAVLAWPTAEIAVMGADGASNIILKATESGKRLDEINPEEGKKIVEEFKEKYTKAFNNPYASAKYGCVTEIINPLNTKDKVYSLIFNLKSSMSNVRKHGNIPL